VASQSVRGNQNVQIQDVSQSSIQIVYEGTPRVLPLEKASVPVSVRTGSPARLVRARSGVVPYAARRGLGDELEAWVNAADPFAGQVIGGRGGCGKTRLAVELCERAEARGWLCGFLSRIADPAALEALVGAPTARLVVVDYAESRVEQLERLLPLLAGGATADAPVRVLLLVRASPKQTGDWSECLRNRSDSLDALLDEFEPCVLEDAPLEPAEREALFEAAAGAFAGVDAPPQPSRQLLGQETFASPLLVVIAAYLAVHGNPEPPSSRASLLDEVLAHEQRYWRADARDLLGDDVLARRVVGLATLAGAGGEGEAAELLRLLPDLTDAPAERRARLARWVHEQYPGSSWWNPLEPDLVGEHLVAEVFADRQDVLAAVLAGRDPERMTQPLEVCARAAADHPAFAAALQPILSAQLTSLCELAVAEATTKGGRDLLYGNTTTVAAALDRAIGSIDVDAAALSKAVDSLPPYPNIVLGPLAVSLGTQLVESRRPLAASDADRAALAIALDVLAIRLAEVGRRPEGLEASEEAVAIYRELAADDLAGFEADLASSLNNLSLQLGESGRQEEGIAAIEDAVEIYRRLPSFYEYNLARSLNNLAIGLRAVGRKPEGLKASEEAVELCRDLASSEETFHEIDLARALNNLSLGLVDAGRRAESLAAIEEAVQVYRRLAAEDPASYEAHLAGSLNNLSNRLAEMRRDDDALAASKESVEVRRSLAVANPAAYEAYLARSLNNHSVRLAEVGRRPEGLEASEEAVAIYRRLATADPVAYVPYLAVSLNTLAVHMAAMGRHEEAERARRESGKLLPAP
jgi:tetratricopeptide (TPR) repeat protein